MILKNSFFVNNKYPDQEVILVDLDDTLIDTQKIKRIKAEIIDTLYKSEIYMYTYYKAKELNNNNYTTQKQADLLLENKFPEGYSRKELEVILEFQKNEIISNLLKDNINKLKTIQLKEKRDFMILTTGDLENQKSRIGVIFPYCNFISYAIIIDYPKEKFFQFDYSNNNLLIEKLKNQKEIIYFNDKEKENINLSNKFPFITTIDINQFNI